MSKSKAIVGDSKDEITDVVILNDETDSYFNIISADTAHCLLPLLGAPIIYYTMLQLINAKFRHFTIFCGIHYKKIKEFFKAVNFKDFIDGKCKIELIGDNIRTPADAIRYLDSKTFDKSFLFIHGDVVTDIDFETITKAFQQKKSKNPNLIMGQIVSTQFPDELRLCSRVNDWVEVDKNNNTLIANEQSEDGIDKRPNSVLLGAVYDPEIYICSNKIPLRFSDQLDCITMDDLVGTVISHAEVVPDEIEVIVVDNSCFRVRDLNTYSFVSKRLIRGGILRLSPPRIYGDNIKAVSAFGKPMTNHSVCYINRRLPDDFISSSSKLIGNVQIQAGSRIGDHCRLHDSVIGYNCHIGNNVTLRNCILMDGVVIGNNCTISDSFICSGAVVNGNCMISEKSVIDYDFQVTAETKCEGHVLSNKSPIDNFWDVVILQKSAPIDRNSVGEDETDNIDNASLFSQDFHVLLREATEEAMSIDNLFLETNRLKHQYNLGIEDVCYGLMEVFVNFPWKESLRDTDPAERQFRSHFLALLQRYGAIISRFVGDSATPVAAARIVTCLEAVELCACDSERVMDSVLDIFFSLYETDIATEDDIMRWYNSSMLLHDDELQEKTEEIRGNLGKLITFFEEAEEEDD